MSARSLHVLSAVALFAATPVRADDANPLDGTWVVARLLDTNGKPMQLKPAVRLEALPLVTIWFRSGSARLVKWEREEPEIFRLTVKLHPSQRPGQIDLIDMARRETMPGIYEVSGDTLRLCIAGGGTDKEVPPRLYSPPDLRDRPPRKTGPRPTEYRSGRGQIAFELKRVSPGPALPVAAPPKRVPGRPPATK